MIHIIGDSHSGLFTATPRAAIHYIGPVTMHRVGRDGVQVLRLDSVNVGTGDALGFCFGEIDVRVHVANQRDRFSRDPTEVIVTLTTGYLATLAAARQIYISSPIVVFSVIPPASYRHPNFDREMPRNGTDQERVAWTRQLNETLKREALRAGFGFVDQYTPFANKRGLLDLHWSRDGVHVTPESIKDDIELVCTFRER